MTILRDDTTPYLPVTAEVGDRVLVAKTGVVHARQHGSSPLKPATVTERNIAQLGARHNRCMRCFR